ncbi:MAG: AAA family ATPase [Anaerolineae bacterium]|nr:AAA family ATPase [Anaerolineae bacterium]
MDYLSFFNLVDEPYSYLKTNPRYFYNAPQYRYAKAILNDGIVNKGAHLYLTGPYGSGKTTLMRVIELDLKEDENNLVFFTYAPKYLRSAHSFLKRLCKEMEIKTERSYVDMLDNFENQVGAWAQAGKTPILLIDEANKLTAPAFDFLHHIMNFVTAERLLIVVVLAGQEELASKIKRRPELRSRMQALSISSLSLDDVGKLLRWRWRVASEDPNNPLPFEPEAIEKIYWTTKGLPRDICSLCDRCLQYAFADEQKVINADLVTTAAQSLHFIKDGHRKS